MSNDTAAFLASQNAFRLDVQGRNQGSLGSTGAGGERQQSSEEQAVNNAPLVQMLLGKPYQQKQRQSWMDGTIPGIGSMFHSKSGPGIAERTWKEIGQTISQGGTNQMSGVQHAEFGGGTHSFTAMVTPGVGGSSSSEIER